MKMMSMLRAIQNQAAILLGTIRTLAWSSWRSKDRSPVLRFRVASGIGQAFLGLGWSGWSVVVCSRCLLFPITLNTTIVATSTECDQSQ